MTLDRLRPLADRLLDPFVRAAKAAGLTPDAISVLAFLLAVGAGLAFYQAGPSFYLLGALLVFLNGWLDLLDGALARELATDSPAGSGSTPSGSPR